MGRHAPALAASHRIVDMEPSQFRKNNVALKDDVEALATAAGRRVGTAGHDAAKSYLVQRLAALELRPYQGNAFELTYRAGGQTFSNLVAVIPGMEEGLSPVLIGAHYDSVISSYCADDNAAAVAIALSAAESLAAAKLSRDVVIALFDAEEPPYFQSSAMGSTRFYHEQRRPEGFHAALIMDLVGHDVELHLPGLNVPVDALANLLFITGAESHASLPGRPASLFAPVGAATGGHAEPKHRRHE